MASKIIAVFWPFQVLELLRDAFSTSPGAAAVSPAAEDLQREDIPREDIPREDLRREDLQKEDLVGFEPVTLSSRG